MNRHVVALVCCLALVGPAGVAAQGFPGGRQGADPFASITAQVARLSEGRTIRVGGRVSPARKIEHSLAVSGVVDAVLVIVGQRVEAGASLVRVNRNVVGESFLPAHLNSRIAGTISAIHVYPGQEVGSGTLAVTVIDDSTLVLEATFSDQDVEDLRRTGFPALTGVSSAGDRFRGRLSQISAEPDYDTGLFTLTIQFPKQPGLYLGMVLLVDITVGVSPELSVVATALGSGNGRDFVWVAAADNTITRREVRRGEDVDGKVVILGGLTLGEKYVLRAAPNLEDGMELGQVLRSQQRGGGAPGSGGTPGTSGGGAGRQGGSGTAAPAQGTRTGG